MGGTRFDREAVGVPGVDAAEQGVNEAFEHFVTDPWAHHFAHGGVVGERFVFDVDSGCEVGHPGFADQAGRRDGVGLERHPEDGGRGSNGAHHRPR